MNYEYLYDEFIMNHYPESYGGKEGMIKNWEQGFAFDHFAEFLDITLDQLIGE